MVLPQQTDIDALVRGQAERFIDPSLPATNYQAEQAIRPAVVCGSGSGAGSPAAGWLGPMLLMRLRVAACGIKMRRRHARVE